MDAALDAAPFSGAHPGFERKGDVCYMKLETTEGVRSLPAVRAIGIEPLLQYLAGVACMRLSLWGKAQQLLRQSLHQLKDPALRRSAWRALAQLAEQREDAAAATEAWRNAAKE